jgi:hypothetical protein
MKIDDLKVKPGQPVAPAWDKLLDFLRRFRLVAGPGVSLSQTPDGTFIAAEPVRAAFDHPFRVTAALTEARVTKGTIEGIVPTIGSNPLDADQPPQLKLKGGPGKDGRSYVALQVKTTMGGLDPEMKGVAEIVHVQTLARTANEIGLQPLAVLKWTQGIPAAFQIVYHNLGHHYVIQTEARGSRHLFYAV